MTRLLVAFVLALFVCACPRALLPEEINRDVRPCYVTDGGPTVAAAGDLPCPKQARVEVSVHKVRRYWKFYRVGAACWGTTTIVFTRDAVLCAGAGRLGCADPAKRFVYVSTLSPWWGETLQHELHHVAIDCWRGPGWRVVEWRLDHGGLDQ